MMGADVPHGCVALFGLIAFSEAPFLELPRAFAKLESFRKCVFRLGSAWSIGILWGMIDAGLRNGGAINTSITAIRKISTTSPT
jgi:hypothetical protein